MLNSGQFDQHYKLQYKELPSKTPPNPSSFQAKVANFAHYVTMESILRKPTNKSITSKYDSMHLLNQSPKKGKKRKKDDLREREDEGTWLKRGLIKRSFSERTDFLVGVKSGSQAVEKPLLILINNVCHEFPKVRYLLGFRKQKII